MRKKLKSITNKLYSVLGIAIILLLWQALCSFGIVADYMLPSPLAVCRAFAGSFSILMGHAKTSLIEALLGLVIGVVLAFVIAVVMDRFHVVYKMTYPLLVITQADPCGCNRPAFGAVARLRYDAEGGSGDHRLLFPCGGRIIGWAAGRRCRSDQPSARDGGEPGANLLAYQAAGAMPSFFSG